MKKLLYLSLTFIAFVSYIGGCSDSSVTDLKSSNSLATDTGGGGGGGTTANPPASMIVAITPSSGLSALGTASVSATVRDAAGALVADGTTVTFAVSSSLGSITPTATTVSGVANATFTAGNTAGTVGVTVTSGSVSASGSITILGADVGSIEFSSATPNVIGVKGSGQSETAIVTFSIKDVNGQSAPDGTSVTFTIDGPKGGESLNPTTASTVGGLAKTILQSGSVAGPVRVTAMTTVSGTPISSSSTGVSIGGGMPSMTHFTLARTVKNLAGLAYVNLQSTVSAFLADRFGNFNVLQGTSISFYTEAGAIDASNVTDALGSTSVIFRTQNPPPLVFSSATPYGSSTPALSGDPANGLATIIAVTRGEECFVDNNGNGVFDGTTIDTFPPSCDLSEPFVDKDDDGIFDAGAEFYVDANQNGVFNGPNGVWDGNIMIWKTIQIAFTGEPTQIVSSPTTFAITAGTGRSFTVCVGDVNANAIMAGSTIAITTDKGTLGGNTSVTIPDILNGPKCLDFTLTSGTTPPVPPATVPAFAANVTIKVTWKVPGVGDLVETRIISGTIE